MKARGELPHAVELLQKQLSTLAAASGVPQAKHSTVKKLPMPIAPDAEDAEAPGSGDRVFHETCSAALSARLPQTSRIGAEEAIKTFKLGFANRTWGYRLPPENRLRGRDPCDCNGQGSCARAATNTSRLAGDPDHRAFGEITRLCRKITAGLHSSTPITSTSWAASRRVERSGARPMRRNHPVRGADAAVTSGAPTFRNVTAGLRIEGFTADTGRVQATRHERVLIAYDAKRPASGRPETLEAAHDGGP